MRKLMMLAPVVALLLAAPAWAQQTPDQGGGDEGPPPPVGTVVHLQQQGKTLDEAAAQLKVKVDQVGQTFGLEFDHYSSLDISYPAGSVFIKADAVLVPGEGDQDSAPPPPSPAPPGARPPGAR
jgi:hypothetical protein